MVGTEWVHRTGLTHKSSIEESCLLKKLLAKMIKAHILDFKKVMFGIFCIFLETVPVPLGTVGRELISGYAVDKDATGSIF